MTNARFHTVLLALACVLAAGCTTTRQMPTAIEQHVVKPEKLRTLEGVSRERAVTVVTFSGSRHRARNLRIRTDTLLWRHPNRNIPQRMSADDVYAVKWKRYGRGALEGAGIGLLWGMGGGLARGVAAYGGGIPGLIIAETT